jgi:hypothetical protein
MDKKEFKDRIAELAEIQDLKPAKVASIRLDETDQNDVRTNDGEWLHINQEVNPTLGFKFIKLKDQSRDCQLGCGDVVINQVVEQRLAFTPQKHWRTKCVTCGCFVSPDGQGFIEGGHQIQAAYMKHFNALKNSNKEEIRNVLSDSQIKDFGSYRPSKWIKDENGNIKFTG